MTPNDPYLIGLPVSRLTDPQEIRIAKAAHTLGCAVHRGALERLYELFPEATVTVEHETMRVPLASDTPIRMDGPRDRAQHSTRVWIDLEGDWQPGCGRRRPGHAIFADAVCHPDDNFDRRKGIELAFRRALEHARFSYRQKREADAYRALVAHP